MFDLGEFRMWTIRADMNGDGSVNVADVWLWIKLLYLYPGDWLIHLIANTAAGRFFNLSPQSYGGELALGVSVIVWLCVADIFVRLFLPKKIGAHSNHERDCRGSGEEGCGQAREAVVSKTPDSTVFVAGAHRDHRCGRFLLFPEMDVAASSRAAIR